MNRCRWRDSLMRDGITTVIATPHQLGRYDGKNLAADIRSRVEALQKALEAKRIPLRVVAGAEVRVDERIVRFLAEDRILTLVDAGKYLLLELPTTVSIDPAMLMPSLAESGITVVLAHAERYENLKEHPESAKAWLDAGALLQVNAGAVVGVFGKSAANAAWDWLARMGFPDRHRRTHRRRAPSANDRCD